MYTHDANMLKKISFPVIFEYYPAEKVAKI